MSFEWFTRITIQYNLMNGKADQLAAELANLLGAVEQNASGSVCPEVDEIRRVMSGSPASSPGSVQSAAPTPVPEKKSTMDLFKEINEARMQRGKMAPSAEGPKRGTGPAVMRRGHFARMALHVDDEEDEDED